MDICAICRDPLENNITTSKYCKCKMKYHEECLNTCMKNNIFCPICRIKKPKFNQSMTNVSPIIHVRPVSPIGSLLCQIFMPLIIIMLLIGILLIPIICISYLFVNLCLILILIFMLIIVITFFSILIFIEKLIKKLIFKIKK